MAGKKASKRITKEERKTAKAEPQSGGWWVTFRRNGKKYFYFHKSKRSPKGIKLVR